MKIYLSNRVNAIGSYAFADVDKLVEELKAKGIEPIDFGVGDPKRPTPELIREACKKALDDRKTAGYPTYIGSNEYRETISKWMKRRFNVSLNPNTEITSSLGGKEAVFNFHFGFVNPGDVVFCPNPGYPPAERGTIFAGGRPVLLPLKAENDFLIDLDSINREDIKKAKIMWINYPNNPTGAVATEDFLKAIIDFGHDNNIIIASDEVYSEIYYGEKPKSILEYDREGIVVIQSLSKRSNMTSYRVGWFAGDENVISTVKKVKTNIDSGTSWFIQDAAIAALKDEKHVEKSRNEYKEKMDVMIEALNSIELEARYPKATFYIWQKAPHGMSSLDFTKKLLQKEIAIITTPGAWISKEVNGENPGEGFVRFALVPSIKETKEAAEKLKNNF